MLSCGRGLVPRRSGDAIRYQRPRATPATGHRPSSSSCLPQEQRERLLARIRDPERHFKFNAGDFESRRRWDDYTRAYEEAIERCSTDHAPWHIIPADRNWLRNYAVAAITLEALREMDPRLPSIQIDQDRAERLLDP